MFVILNTSAFWNKKPLFVLVLAPPRPLHPNPNNDGGVFPSFRYNNNRNFWLEYSTPPSTTFPEYEEYYEMRPTTPDPRPYFLNGDLKNNSVVEIPLGGTVFLDCEVAQFTSEFEVNETHSDKYCKLGSFN